MRIKTTDYFFGGCCGADVDWYVKADDILLKNKGTHAGNPQNNAPQQPPKK